MAMIEINGRAYPLDRIPEAPRLFAQLPRLRDAYSVDPAKWSESDQIGEFAPPILNQIQNGCVGHGGSTAFTLAWSQSGQAAPDGGFSPTWLYALLNGGVDQGAMIGDLVGAMTNVGVATAKTFPESKYMLGGAAEKAARPEAALYKADEVYAFATWEELGTGLARGLPGADSVMVGGSFNNLDGNGVVGVDRGSGNHCVAMGALRKLGGQWQAGHQNSWGADWGQRGRFWTTQAHVLSQRYYSGIFIKSIKRVGTAPGPNGVGDGIDPESNIFDGAA